CFPDAITEHRTIDKAHWQNAPGAHDRLALEHTSERGEQHIHRQEYYDERQHRAPYTKWQRCQQEQIHHRRYGDENDLEKPDTGQTEPAERAIVPVEHHVSMFPQTLQRAVGPA